MRDNFNVQKVRLYMVDEEQQKFYSYSDLNEKITYPIDIGIAGEAYRHGEMLNITNAYNHPTFNISVDLDTAMPIIVKPLRR